MYHRVSLLILTTCFSVHCGSLLSELDRIRKKAETTNTASATTPTVISTDPADNSIGPYSQTYIDVTFSEAISTASFIAQSTFGACSGSFQVSYDGFQNCLGGTLDISGNPRIRFIPSILPKALGLQIRVTAAVVNNSGIATTPYTSPVGFRFAAPCGAQNCFFSFSTPLMTVATGVSGIFPVRSGSKMGRFIVYTGASTTTTIVDPINATSEIGPTLAACFTPGAGAHDFYISSGTHIGKQLLVQGGNNQNTCLFDPATNTFSPGPNLLALNAGADGLSMQPDSGPDSGNTIFLRAFATNTVFRYTASTGLISNSGMVPAGTFGTGAHAIRLINGTNAGQWLIFNGGSTSTTNFFDPAGPLVAGTGFPTFFSVGAGSSSFEVFAGARAGQIITVVGGASPNTSVYNVGTFAAGTTGPALTANAAAGGLLLRMPGSSSFDYPLVIHGNATTTSLYNSTTGTFGVGPLTTGVVGSGSSKIIMKSNSGSDFFFIINGVSSSTSIYMPGINSFHGSRMPSDMPTLGASAFPIKGGTHSGKTLILGATGSTNTDTTMYDPIKHEMTQGPSALGMPGSPTTMFAAFNQGPYANQVLVFRGFGLTTFQVYNPATHAFSVPGGFPSSGAFAAINTGGVAFPLANDTRIFIVNGNGTVAQTLDQQTAAVVTLGALPAPVNAAPMHVRFARPSTGAVKELVYATGLTFLVIDHATLTPSSTPAPSAAGNGVQAFVIPSGPQVNNVLIIHGANSATTSLLDPETNVISSTSTNLATCAGAGVGLGSQLMAITAGVNKGKYLLIVGNGQTLTCLYDPAAHSFAPGAPVSTTGSPGYLITNASVAFPTGGGLYPTSFVLVSGNTSNVWSTYVP